MGKRAGRTERKHHGDTEGTEKREGLEEASRGVTPRFHLASTDSPSRSFVLRVSAAGFPVGRQRLRRRLLYLTPACCCNRLRAEDPALRPAQGISLGDIFIPLPPSPRPSPCPPCLRGELPLALARGNLPATPPAAGPAGGSRRPTSPACPNSSRSDGSRPRSPPAARPRSRKAGRETRKAARPAAATRRPSTS